MLRAPRCAVLGSPISHSLSPVMHRAAYAEVGLDWTYEAIDIRRGGLAHFLERCDDSWRGFSVTAPLKHEAAALAATRSTDVQVLEVANTLIPWSGGWEARNTDVPGAISALRAGGVTGLETVRILGAGATATSFAYVAHRLGAVSVEFAVRSPERAAETVAFAERLGLAVSVSDIAHEPIRTVDLVVSTVPASAVAGTEHAIVGTASSVFEVVYDPWPTDLMRSAQADGTPLVTGIDLLAHQAVLQVEAMTGTPVDPDLLLSAALSELASRNT